MSMQELAEELSKTCIKKFITDKDELTDAAITLQISNFFQQQHIDDKDEKMRILRLSTLYFHPDKTSSYGNDDQAKLRAIFEKFIEYRKRLQEGLPFSADGLGSRSSSTNDFSMQELEETDYVTRLHQSLPELMGNLLKMMSERKLKDVSRFFLEFMLAKTLMFLVQDESFSTNHPTEINVEDLKKFASSSWWETMYTYSFLDLLEREKLYKLLGNCFRGARPCDPLSKKANDFMKYFMYPVECLQQLSVTNLLLIVRQRPQSVYEKATQADLEKYFGFKTLEQTLLPLINLLEKILKARCYSLDTIKKPLDISVERLLIEFMLAKILAFSSKQHTVADLDFHEIWFLTSKDFETIFRTYFDFSGEPKLMMESLIEYFHHIDLCGFSVIPGNIRLELFQYAPDRLQQISAMKFCNNFLQNGDDFALTKLSTEALTKRFDLVLNSQQEKDLEASHTEDKTSSSKVLSPTMEALIAKMQKKKQPNTHTKETSSSFTKTLKK